MNSYAAVLRLGLGSEGLGEAIAVTALFNDMNRIADGDPIEPEVKLKVG